MCGGVSSGSLLDSLELLVALLTSLDVLLSLEMLLSLETLLALELERDMLELEFELLVLDTRLLELLWMLELKLLELLTLLKLLLALVSAELELTALELIELGAAEEDGGVSGCWLSSPPLPPQPVSPTTIKMQTANLCMMVPHQEQIPFRRFARAVFSGRCM